MTEQTVQQYYDWPKLDVPARHSRMKLGIVEIKGFCAGCAEPTTDYRGVVREYLTCLEIEFAGICRRCKIVTFARNFRMYPWGVLERRDGRWVWVHYKRLNIFKSLWAYASKIKGRICNVR